MYPVSSVTYVPGLYPALANTGCCRQCGRPLWSRIAFSAAALQQNPVSLACLTRRSFAFHLNLRASMQTAARMSRHSATKLRSIAARYVHEPSHAPVRICRSIRSGSHSVTRLRPS
jgi:hypothetical protein